MHGVLYDVRAGLLEGDTCSRLHGYLPGEGVPGFLDLWDAIRMSSDELFESLDVTVYVGFVSNSDEGPCPADCFEAIHDPQEGVWVA